MFTALLPTPFGLFLAVQLDRKIRFTRVYQTAFFLPVVLSLAVIGFVWELIYNPDTGLINSLLGARRPATTSTGSATPTSTCGPSWSPRPGGTPAT